MTLCSQHELLEVSLNSGRKSPLYKLILRVSFLFRDLFATFRIRISSFLPYPNSQGLFTKDPFMRFSSLELLL